MDKDFKVFWDGCSLSPLEELGLTKLIPQVYSDYEVCINEEIVNELKKWREGTNLISQLNKWSAEGTIRILPKLEGYAKEINEICCNISQNNSKADSKTWVPKQHWGEACVICSAREYVKKGYNVLMVSDNEGARSEAKRNGISKTTIYGVLKTAKNQGQLTETEFEESIQKLKTMKRRKSF